MSALDLKRRLWAMVVLAFAWLVLTTLALQTFPPSDSVVNRVCLNSLSLYLVIAPLLVFTPLSGFILKTPRPHLAASILLFCFVVVGHLCGRSRSTFPFVAWDMYHQSLQLEQIVEHQIYFILEDGEHVCLNPTKLMPAMHNNFFARLQHWAEDYEEWGEKHWVQYQEILEGLGRRYYEIRPEEPISQVYVLRKVTTYDEFLAPHVHEEEFFRARLDLRGSNAANSPGRYRDDRRALHQTRFWNVDTAGLPLAFGTCHLLAR